MTAMPACSASRGVANRAGLPLDEDLALVAAVRVHAAEKIDERRFAGAILAAQGVDLARPQVEAHALERDDTAEALDDAVRRKESVAAHLPASPSLAGRRFSGTPRYTSSKLCRPSLITVSTMLSLVTVTTSESTDGTSIVPLFTVCGAHHDLALRDAYRQVRGVARQYLERLVDRHGLSAVDDALAGDELGILTSDQLPAREPLFEQRLDSAAGGAVIAREHRIEGVSLRGDGRVDDALRVLRLPVLHPVLVHDDDIAPLDVRCEHVVLALLEELRIVVGLCTVETHDSALAGSRQVIHQVACLQLADLDVVEADVEVEVAVADDAVIGNDGNSGVVCHADRLCHRPAVVRHDHQHVDAVGDQLLDVADLNRVVAVRREIEDARAKLRGPLHEHVTIGLPASLLERVERQANEELLIARGLRGAVPASERQADQDAQRERCHDQENLRAHAASPRYVQASHASRRRRSPEEG